VEILVDLRGASPSKDNNSSFRLSTDSLSFLESILMATMLNLSVLISEREIVKLGVGRAYMAALLYRPRWW
jgi:hypothetical protein